MDSFYLAGTTPVQRKCLAAVLAVVVFLTNGLFAYASESNFWTERRRAQASLPTADLSLPSVSPIVTRGLSASARRLLPADAPKPLVDLIASLPADLVTIRKVSGPSNGASVGPLVLHVQDVHQNLEAQRNIGKLVESLGTTPKLVALEGAFGPMDLGPFRRPEYGREMRLAADYMFHEGLLTGSVYAGLTRAGDIPPFVGVDDAAHYKANVEAYRSSAPRQAEMKNLLSETAKTLEARKAAVFNPDLLELDKTITAYRSGKLPLGEYARRLMHGQDARATDATTRAWHGLPAHAHRSLDLFFGALALEESLDFKRVEAERARLIESLVRKLSKNQLDDLLVRSAAYRAGQIQYGEFYAYLRDLAGGELLSRFPAMDAYVRYVLLADAIDSEKLFEELKSLEETACLRLARTEEEKQLLAESRRLFLTRKLADFTLTPEEWKEYENGMSTGGTPVPREGMASFESFYREADARDAAMSGNLLGRLAGVKSVAVLITGGYHSRGMDKRLAAAGCAVVSVTPKLTKVDMENGSAYLSIFAQEKTPLDKLVEGDKLFLSRLQLTADPKVVEEAALLAAAQDPTRAQSTYRAISGRDRRVKAKREGPRCRITVPLRDGEAGFTFDNPPDRIDNVQPFFIPKSSAWVAVTGFGALALSKLLFVKGAVVFFSQQVLTSPLAGTLFIVAVVVLLAVILVPAYARREMFGTLRAMLSRKGAEAFDRRHAGWQVPFLLDTTSEFRKSLVTATLRGAAAGAVVRLGLLIVEQYFSRDLGGSFAIGLSFAIVMAAFALKGHLEEGHVGWNITHPPAYRRDIQAGIEAAPRNGAGKRLLSAEAVASKVRSAAREHIRRLVKGSDLEEEAVKDLYRRAGLAKDFMNRTQEEPALESYVRFLRAFSVLESPPRAAAADEDEEEPAASGQEPPKAPPKRNELEELTKTVDEALAAEIITGDEAGTIRAVLAGENFGEGGTQALFESALTKAITFGQGSAGRELKGFLGTIQGEELPSPRGPGMEEKAIPAKNRFLTREETIGLFTLRKKCLGRGYFDLVTEIHGALLDRYDLYLRSKAAAAANGRDGELFDFLLAEARVLMLRSLGRYDPKRAPLGAYLDSFIPMRLQQAKTMTWHPFLDKKIVVTARARILQFRQTVGVLPTAQELPDLLPEYSVADWNAVLHAALFMSQSLDTPSPDEERVNPLHQVDRSASSPEERASDASTSEELEKRLLSLPPKQYLVMRLRQLVDRSFVVDHPPTFERIGRYFGVRKQLMAQIAHGAEASIRKALEKGSTFRPNSRTQSLKHDIEIAVTRIKNDLDSSQPAPAEPPYVELWKDLRHNRAVPRAISKQPPSTATWGLWEWALVAMGMDRARARRLALRYGSKAEALLTLLLFVGLTVLLERAGLAHWRSVGLAALGSQTFFSAMHLTEIYRWDETLGGYEPVPMFGARAPPPAERLKILSVYFLKSLLWHAPFYALLAFAPTMTQLPVWAFFAAAAVLGEWAAWAHGFSNERTPFRPAVQMPNAAGRVPALTARPIDNGMTGEFTLTDGEGAWVLRKSLADLRGKGPERNPAEPAELEEPWEPISPKVIRETDLQIIMFAVNEFARRRLGVRNPDMAVVKEIVPISLIAVANQRTGRPEAVLNLFTAPLDFDADPTYAVQLSDGRYLILGGSRRLVAARLKGMEYVPLQVILLTDAERQADFQKALGGGDFFTVDDQVEGLGDWFKESGTETAGSGARMSQTLPPGAIGIALDGNRRKKAEGAPAVRQGSLSDRWLVIRVLHPLVEAYANVIENSGPINLGTRVGRCAAASLRELGLIDETASSLRADWGSLVRGLSPSRPNRIVFDSLMNSLGFTRQKPSRYQRAVDRIAVRAGRMMDVRVEVSVVTRMPPPGTLRGLDLKHMIGFRREGDRLRVFVHKHALESTGNRLRDIKRYSALALAHEILESDPDLGLTHAQVEKAGFSLDHEATRDLSVVQILERARAVREGALFLKGKGTAAIRRGSETRVILRAHALDGVLSGDLRLRNGELASASEDFFNLFAPAGNPEAVKAAVKAHIDWSLDPNVGGGDRIPLNLVLMALGKPAPEPGAEPALSPEDLDAFARHPEAAKWFLRGLFPEFKLYGREVSDLCRAIDSAADPRIPLSQWLGEFEAPFPNSVALVVPHGENMELVERVTLDEIKIGIAHGIITWGAGPARPVFAAGKGMGDIRNLSVTPGREPLRQQTLPPGASAYWKTRFGITSLMRIGWIELGISGVLAIAGLLLAAGVLHVLGWDASPEFLLRLPYARAVFLAAAVPPTLWLYSMHKKHGVLQSDGSAAPKGERVLAATFTASVGIWLGALVVAGVLATHLSPLIAFAGLLPPLLHPLINWLKEREHRKSAEIGILVASGEPRLLDKLDSPQVLALVPVAEKALREMAVEAGKIMAKVKREGLGIEPKPGEGPVTLADKSISEMVLRTILSRPEFADHYVRCEENTEGFPYHWRNLQNKAKEPDFVWIVDPLDGTQAFIEGGRSYSFMMTLTFQGNPVAAVTFSPEADEGIMLSWSLLSGPRRNGERLGVAPQPREGAPFVARVDLGVEDIFKARWQEALPNVPIVDKIESHAQSVAMIASGFWRFVSNPFAKVWDVAAPSAILLGAGGSVYRWDGRPLFPLSKEEMFGSPTGGYAPPDRPEASRVNRPGNIPIVMTGSADAELVAGILASRMEMDEKRRVEREAIEAAPATGPPAARVAAEMILALQGLIARRAGPGDDKPILDLAGEILPEWEPLLKDALDNDDGPRLKFWGLLLGKVAQGRRPVASLDISETLITTVSSREIHFYPAVADALGDALVDDPVYFTTADPHESVENKLLAFHQDHKTLSPDQRLHIRLLTQSDKGRALRAADADLELDEYFVHVGDGFSEGGNAAAALRVAEIGVHVGPQEGKIFPKTARRHELVVSKKLNTDGAAADTIRIIHAVRLLGPRAPEAPAGRLRKASRLLSRLVNHPRTKAAGWVLTAALMAGAVVVLLWEPRLLGPFARLALGGWGIVLGVALGQRLENFIVARRGPSLSGWPRRLVAALPIVMVWLAIVVIHLSSFGPTMDWKTVLLFANGVLTAGIVAALEEGQFRWKNIVRIFRSPQRRNSVFRWMAAMAPFTYYLFVLYIGHAMATPLLPAENSAVGVLVRTVIDLGFFSIFGNLLMLFSFKGLIDERRTLGGMWRLKGRELPPYFMENYRNLLWINNLIWVVFVPLAWALEGAFGVGDKLVITLFYQFVAMPISAYIFASQRKKPKASPSRAGPGAPSILPTTGHPSAQTPAAGENGEPNSGGTASRNKMRPSLPAAVLPPIQLPMLLTEKEIERVACPLCGRGALPGDTLAYHVINGFRLPMASCPKDGMIWLAERPIQAWREASFRSPAYLQNSLGGQFGYGGKYDDSTRATIARERVAQVEEQFGAAGLPENKTWLDVGAAEGHVLEAARGRGWNVQGIELNQQGIDRMKAKGISVMGSGFEDADVPEESADVVSFYDSFEYPNDLRKAVEKARRILKENGMLVIRLPDFSGLTRENAPAFLGVGRERLYCMTRDTIRTLLNQHGFPACSIVESGGKTIDGNVRPSMTIYARGQGVGGDVVAESSVSGRATSSVVTWLVEKMLGPKAAASYVKNAFLWESGSAALLGLGLGLRHVLSGSHAVGVAAPVIGLLFVVLFALSHAFRRDVLEKYGARVSAWKIGLMSFLFVAGMIIAPALSQLPYIIAPDLSKYSADRLVTFFRALAVTWGMIFAVHRGLDRRGQSRPGAGGAGPGEGAKPAVPTSILEREGLSGFPALGDLLTPEDIKVLEEYPMLRPVFMVRYSEERGEVGPLQVTGERHVRALGRGILADRGDPAVEDEGLQLKTGREAMDRLTGFGAGPLQTADRLAREGVPMFVAFTDRAGESFNFRVSNGRRVYVREANLWLSMKGGGQNNRPDEAPWFVAHTSKGDVRYEGLTFDRGPDADQRARMEASDGSFTPSPAWRTLNVLEDGQGRQVPVAGISELQAAGSPALTFEIVSPLRLDKMKQMRESDPGFEKWLARFRADQRRRGLPEPENVADMLTMIVERIAATQAAKQNLGLGKRSAVTPQDHDESGFESDNEEVVPLEVLAEFPAAEQMPIAGGLIRDTTNGVRTNIMDVVNFCKYFLLPVSRWLESDKGDLDVPISRLPADQLARHLLSNPHDLGDLRLRLLKTFFQTYFQRLNRESLDVLTRPVGWEREWNPGAYLAGSLGLGALLGSKDYNEAVGGYIQNLLLREVNRRNGIPRAGTGPSAVLSKTVAARAPGVAESRATSVAGVWLFRGAGRIFGRSADERAGRWYVDHPWIEAVIAGAVAVGLGLWVGLSGSSTARIYAPLIGAVFVVVFAASHALYYIPGVKAWTEKNGYEIGPGWDKITAVALLFVLGFFPVFAAYLNPSLQASFQSWNHWTQFLSFAGWAAAWTGIVFSQRKIEKDDRFARRGKPGFAPRRIERDLDRLMSDSDAYRRAHVRQAVRMFRAFRRGRPGYERWYRAIRWPSVRKKTPDKGEFFNLLDVVRRLYLELGEKDRLALELAVLLHDVRHKPGLGDVREHPRLGAEAVEEILRSYGVTDPGIVSRVKNTILRHGNLTDVGVYLFMSDAATTDRAQLICDLIINLVDGGAKLHKGDRLVADSLVSTALVRELLERMRALGTAVSTSQDFVSLRLNHAAIPLSVYWAINGLELAEPEAARLRALAAQTPEFDAPWRSRIRMFCYNLFVLLLTTGDRSTRVERLFKLMLLFAHLETLEARQSGRQGPFSIDLDGADPSGGRLQRILAGLNPLFARPVERISEEAVAAELTRTGGTEAFGLRFRFVDGGLRLDPERRVSPPEETIESNAAPEPNAGSRTEAFPGERLLWAFRLRNIAERMGPDLDGHRPRDESLAEMQRLFPTEEEISRHRGDAAWNRVHGAAVTAFAAYREGRPWNFIPEALLEGNERFPWVYAIARSLEAADRTSDPDKLIALWRKSRLEDALPPNDFIGDPRISSDLQSFLYGLWQRMFSLRSHIHTKALVLTAGSQFTIKLSLNPDDFIRETEVRMRGGRLVSWLGNGMIPALAAARLAGLMRSLKGRIGAMNVARLYRWALVSPLESGFGLRGKEGISIWGILTRGDLPVVAAAWLTLAAGGNMGLVTAAFAAFFAAVRIPFILAHPKGLRWGAAMASVTGLLLFLTMFFGFHMPAAGAAAMGLAGHSLWNLLADALRPAAVVNREYLDMAVRLGRRDPESAAEIFEKILGPVDRLDMNSLDGKVSAKPGPLDPSLLDPAETRIVVLNALSVNTPEDLERVVKAMARPGVVFTSDEQSVVDLVASKLTDHPGAEAKLAGDRLFENGSLHLDALNRVLPSGAETVEVVAPKDSGPVIREDDTDPRLSRAEVKSLESLLRLIEYLGILNAFIERQA